MHSSQQIDWSKVGAEVYDYWYVCIGLATVIGLTFRSRIWYQLRRFMDAMRSAEHSLRKIDSLTARLNDARSQAEDWRQRFSEMFARYEALQSEIARLGEDMHDFHKRMTTAEVLVRILTQDRDALIDHTRLLIGQIFQSGGTPSYPTPPLKSMVDVPGPPLPPYPEVKK